VHVRVRVVAIRSRYIRGLQDVPVLVLILGLKRDLEGPELARRNRNWLRDVRLQHVAATSRAGGSLIGRHLDRQYALRFLLAAHGDDDFPPLGLRELMPQDLSPFPTPIDIRGGHANASGFV
jgi:hypothetical protein